MTLLHPGDIFPDLELHPVDGEDLSVREHLAGRMGVVLLTRGAWCPFCNAQLRGFQRALPDLEALDASVVSLSVDDEPTARGLVAKHSLTFPVGHSADGHKVAEATGAFLNPDPVFLQSTGFVLDPEGRVLLSSYSSGAIGRLTPEDTVGMIRYVRSSPEPG